MLVARVSALLHLSVFSAGAMMPFGGWASTLAKWGKHADEAIQVADTTTDSVRAVEKTAASACSFSGATTVLMADGTRKPIEDIKVGDRVVATDPETGEQAAKPSSTCGCTRTPSSI
jgi:hypothetical protein